MNRMRLEICFAAWVMGLLVGSAWGQPQDYLSPIAVVADKKGERLYIAGETGKTVLFLDVGKNAVSKTLSLPEPLSGIEISADATTLYVTSVSVPGHVFVVDIAQAKVIATLPVEHAVFSPVIHPQKRDTLYVCHRFRNEVLALHLATGKITARIPVIREPFAAAITSNGSSLFVANLLPAGAANQAYLAASISVIDLSQNKVVQNIPLPNGAASVRSLCLSPDNQYAYCVFTLSRYALPTTQIERGWMNTSALGVIEVAGRKLIATALLDDVDLGAANPWSVRCTADNAFLCVAHAGTHELSLIDRAAFHKRLSEPSSLTEELSLMTGIRRRIKLLGVGPRSMAITKNRIYVPEYFSDSMTLVSLEGTNVTTAAIPLGAKKPEDAVRLGERYFNDATSAFQQWQSCASCHPDARSDSFNWDLLNDGIGNPKNTKSMVMATQTAPAMISGVRDRAETAVRTGMRFIQFAARPEEEMRAIDEYLRSLTPFPSPYLVNGKLSPSATRGKAVFEKATCVSCHPAPLFTTLKKYALGLGDDMDKDRAFDTPTLVELWRTSPYLYNGRAATLKEVLTKCNSGDKHGVTSALSEQELNDLVEFLQSQ